MELSINILQVLYGDAIIINYPCTNGKYHNIIVDGGFAGTYQRTLKKEVRQIIENNQKIDLFIITHVDQDHIGGVLSFIKDYGDSNLVNEYWFNWSHNDEYIPDKNNKISIGQGIKLRDYLASTEKLVQEPIYNKNKDTYKYDATLSVLSPDQHSLQKFRNKWNEVEKNKLSQLISAHGDDYHLPINELTTLPFIEDNSLENRNSIAFLFQYLQKKILMLGDAHPSVVRQTLESKGYGKDNKLKVDYVKMAHHGSKHNTCPQLLMLLDCDNYIISANGNNKHCLPNKEALARVITNPGRDMNRLIRFFFNYDNQTLRNIFNTEDFQKYNFKCIYPGAGDNGLRIRF